MDFAQLIQKNRTTLKDELSDAIEDVCNFLEEKEVITKRMRRRIMEENNSNSKRAGALLDLIPNRGDNAHAALYEACKRSGLVKSADILGNASHQLETKNGSLIAVLTDSILPSKWPNAEWCDIVKNRKLVVKTVEKESNSQMYQIYQTHLNQSNIYPMKRKIRGRALIIVNKTFPGTELVHRSGADVDEVGLEQLFDGLGFLVTTKLDEKAEGIKSLLEDEATVDHSNYDCFVLYIGSHGKHQNLFGINGQSVSLTSIVQQIERVESLKGKPKLFLFQICQGDHNELEVIRGKKRQVEDDVNLGGNRNEDLTSLLFPDCFVMQSAPAGFRANRHERYGSWFTQAFIYTFAKFAHQYEISALFQKTNNLVSISEGREDKRVKNSCQMTTYPNTMFYFFPGLYDEENGCSS